MAKTKTSNGLKHRDIEEQLLVQIESGKYEIGHRLSTGGKIAEEFNVSRPTADKAITNLVTRGYVERSPGRGTFVRNWHAVKPILRQADSISVICTSADQTIYGPFMHDGSRLAEENGYDLTYGSLSDDDDWAVPLAIRNKRAVGSLVVTALNEDQARVLLAEDLPCLFVGNHRETFGQPCVRLDMEDAGYQIAKKLLELDRGPVWLLIEPTTKVHYSLELLQGYQRAVIEHPNAHCKVHITRGAGYHENEYAGLAQQIVAGGPRPFCAMGDHLYIYRLGQQFGPELIDIKQSAVALAGRLDHLWPHADQMLVCDVTLVWELVEGIKQLIATAQTGAPVTGKTFKLHIETVDDPAQPWRFLWQ